mgnify:CR=1 FL=1
MTTQLIRIVNYGTGNKGNVAVHEYFLNSKKEILVLEQI